MLLESSMIARRHKSSYKNLRLKYRWYYYSSAAHSRFTVNTIDEDKGLWTFVKMLHELWVTQPPIKLYEHLPKKILYLWGTWKENSVLMAIVADGTYVARAVQVVGGFQLLLERTGAFSVPKTLKRWDEIEHDLSERKIIPQQDRAYRFYIYSSCFKASMH